ncbi:MAG: M3 family metallopeptidase [Synechococcus sp.]|nr:M3 family metallopeptidase [Synechococcus sp.]
MPQTLSPSAELLRGEGLPNYQAISPEAVGEAMPQLLAELEQQLEALETSLTQGGSSSWDQLMAPLQRLGERLRWSWGVVGHLLGVCNTPELREAHEQQQAAVVRFSSRLGQSQPIYNALEQLEAQAESLDRCQQRIVAQERLGMQLRGVGLSGEEQQRFNQLSEELSALSTRFSNNVLDATAAWELLLSKPEEVAGCPSSLLELLADAARQQGHDGATAAAGPWLLGLDHPRYGPFLRFADRRDLREQAYRAFISRADEGNKDLVADILKRRQEKAELLGYRNWAEVSLASKMAPSVASVEQLLEDLRAPAISAAQAELKDLTTLAGSELEPWDLSYWAEKRRQQRFDLDSEALRPYFPLPQVLDGLFGLCQRLFGIRISAADGEAPLWHSDVRFFRVSDASSGAPLAAFYLDPYSRPGSKRGGAWMDECLGRQRSSNGELVLPVAYLICNQTPPVGDAPSLMSFDEVETLFHEFGHGLQHMLTTVEQPEAAGINGVEWDAVELPSQFMENWCYDGPTLDAIARHWQSGEPLPESERQKLLQARTFMAGSATLRQVHLALTDLRLHATWRADAGISPEGLRRQVAETTTVLPLLEEDALLCSFGHIFAGGYSAGYYSYKWAEVLSADAFAAFEDAGLDDEQAVQDTGRRFRATVLSLGGSEAPADVFERFRGRSPSADALLRHSGLIAA